MVFVAHPGPMPSLPGESNSLSFTATDASPREGQILNIFLSLDVCFCYRQGGGTVSRRCAAWAKDYWRRLRDVLDDDSLPAPVRGEAPGKVLAVAKGCAKRGAPRFRDGETEPPAALLQRRPPKHGIGALRSAPSIANATTTSHPSPSPSPSLNPYHAEVRISRRRRVDDQIQVTEIGSRTINQRATITTRSPNEKDAIMTSCKRLTDDNSLS